MSTHDRRAEIPEAPWASVVIAARDEAAVIASTLSTLTSSLDPGEVDVVVVCNGCRDATADLARAHRPRVRVIEVEVASKVAALRAGDAATAVFPRVYLDADVRLTSGDLRRLVGALDASGVPAASTRLSLDTTAATLAHRSYLRIWRNLPSVRTGLTGRGVYALSAAGHGRVGEFPDVTNDDAFVDSLFSSGERVIADAESVVTVAGGVRDLLRRKTRIVQGHGELAGRDDAGPLRTSRTAWLGVVARRPWLAVDVPVYLYVALSARVRARGSGRIDWGGPSEP